VKPSGASRSYFNIDTLLEVFKILSTLKIKCFYNYSYIFWILDVLYAVVCYDVLLYM
jgi:hypothetical protein